MLIKFNNYYGWFVSEKDPLYSKLLENNKSIIDNDKKIIKKIISKYVNNNTVALDIGCNYRFMTEFLSKHFTEVHAFDFDNDIHNCFKKNMQKFECNNVVAHPYGLGHVNAMTAINDWSTVKNFRVPLATHVDPKGKIKNQQIKTLDELKIEKVGLMMIDTEGFELMVLKGAEQTIRAYSPVIILEYHHKNLTEKFGYKKEEIIKFLERQLDYVVRGYINTVDLLCIKK